MNIYEFLLALGFWQWIAVITIVTILSHYGFATLAYIFAQWGKRSRP